MGGGKLPELRRGDAIRLIKAFSCEFEQEDDVITGNGRDGQSFTITSTTGRVFVRIS